MGLVIHHDLEARGGIYLLVNSVGGSLQAALGLHDCMAGCPASRSVATVLYGLVASSAVLIGASGDFRVGLQHGRFMLHQSEGCWIEVLATAESHQEFLADGQLDVAEAIYKSQAEGCWGEVASGDFRG